MAIFGTHPKQFNGYSKVVYELCKHVAPRHAGVKLFVFGFQNFHNHPGHRNDVPPDVDVYDPHAEETPKAAGFGVPLARTFVERVRPDVVIIFNDLIVLTTILNEVRQAANRATFKVLAYVDQVYTYQRRDLIEAVNLHADGAIAFTPEWRDCIVGQGLRIPCRFLAHGVNTKTYFPVPKALARRFFGIADGDFLILNLNRNQPRKRWDTCIQAFAEVVRRLPGAPIKLVVGTDLRGSWDLMALFERELRKRGVAPESAKDRIVVPGHPQMLTDDETNLMYNIADIGINTCDGEGFGLCNFEQAAIGIPQIVPRVGGFVHFFDDGIATFVEPRMSIYIDSARDGVGGEAMLSFADDYAEAIIRYYRDPELRAKHGRDGRASILSRFGWDAISDQLVDILREAVPAPPPQQHTPLADAPLATEVALKISAVDAILSGGCPTEEGAPMDEERPPVFAVSAAAAARGLGAMDMAELRALRRRLDALLGDADADVS